MESKGGNFFNQKMQNRIWKNPNNLILKQNLGGEI